MKKQKQYIYISCLLFLSVIFCLNFKVIDNNFKPLKALDIKVKEQKIQKDEYPKEYYLKEIDLLGTRITGDANAEKIKMVYNILKVMPNADRLSLEFVEEINSCGLQEVRAWGCSGFTFSRQGNINKKIIIDKTMPDEFFTGVFVHEYGHTFRFSSQVPDIFKDTSNAVSNYGKLSPYENVAETFAMYVLRGNKFRELIKEDQELKEKYLFFQYTLAIEFETGSLDELSKEYIGVNKYDSEIKVF